jgi:hypothetical protein
MSRRKVLGFGLDYSNGEGLRIRSGLDPKGIVHPALARTPDLPSAEVQDFASGFLAPDEFFRPSSLMDRRIDQFGAGVGFA